MRNENAIFDGYNPPVSLAADSFARRETAPFLSAPPTFSPAIGGNRPLHKGAFILLSFMRHFFPCVKREIFCVDKETAE